MKNYLLLTCLVSSIALADPAVKSVQVNIHNDSNHEVMLQSFTASRIFENANIQMQTISPNTAIQKAITFDAFDSLAMTVNIPILVDNEKMQLMWQTNMGFDAPDAEKFHICGVIKDNQNTAKHEYCDLPYVVGETLMIDYIIQ
jgi:hypothetical protein